MSTFEGRSVLVTGGGTGIGKGCALHFLEHGAIVTIAGPEGDVLESAATELRHATGRSAVRTAVCDVTDEDLVRDAVATAVDDGGLDVLVANAGTGWPGPVQLLDKAQWHVAYDVNVVGTALCIKHASHAMRSRGGGAVVALSSVEALRAGKFMPAYNVTKAALDSLVACAARELGALGIRVNGVRPGVILTDAVRTQLTEKSVAAGLRQTYLGRLGTPADIAQAVAFLASDDASWVTGQMLNVCGGLSVHDGANYEGLARMVFGDEHIDATKPRGSSSAP
ncbi:SDR family NAD(P)-dependent oxidoreductase [Mycobacterium sp. DL440]|uniref:SDR family NAD(P)-dependent oxidoreductase n=1 Tax=Mycobacterium sp. DL440 TaxID=2675523 RepID=UPI0014211567|nr:SDR family oxidoreductase [Mycobacterium sp. DL440]